MIKENSEIRKTLNPDLISRIEFIQKKAGPILQRATNVLIQYTDHSIEHSLKVEKIYDIILNRAYDVLTDNEKFFLIAATLLHDLGMVGTQDDVNTKSLEEFRNQHHLKSKERIIMYKDNLGLNHSEAVIVGRIAEAHRKETLSSIDENMSYGIGENIRLRLLCSLLRLADELHITPDRADILTERIIIKDETSKLHFEKHKSVFGISCSVRNKNEIIISAHVDDWEIEDVLNELFDEITVKFKNIKPILEYHKIKLSIIKKQFDDNDLIRKEIIKSLLGEELSKFEIIKKTLNRKKEKIESELEKLITLGFVLENNNYTLQNNIKIFRDIFNIFYNSKYEKDFIKSKYVSQNIEYIFKNITLEKYCHRLTKGEIEDRKLILQNSPSAFNFLLNEQEAHLDYGQLERLEVLDLNILAGFMKDVTQKPDYAKELDVPYAIQAIENNLHKYLESKVMVLREIALGNTEIIKDPVKLQNDENKKITFKVKGKVSQDALPHTNMIVLLGAASSANQPIRIDKNVTIESTSKELEPLVGKDLSIIMSPSRPEKSILKFDSWAEISDCKELNELTVKLYSNKKHLNKPFLVSCNMISKNNMNFSFRTSPFASAADRKFLDIIISKMSMLEYRRVYFTNSDDNQLFISSCPRNVMTTDKENNETLEKLISFENIYKNEIGVPVRYSEGIITRVNELNERVIRSEDDKKNTN